MQNFLMLCNFSVFNRRAMVAHMLAFLFVNRRNTVFCATFQPKMIYWQIKVPDNWAIENDRLQLIDFFICCINRRKQVRKTSASSGVSSPHIQLTMGHQPPYRGLYVFSNNLTAQSIYIQGVGLWAPSTLCTYDCFQM